MFLKKPNDRRYTLAFKLTLWYGTIFFLSSLTAFYIFYTSAVSSIYGRLDSEIREEVEDITGLYSEQGMNAVIQEIQEENGSEDTDKLFLRLMEADGSKIISTDLLTWAELDSPETLHKRLTENQGPVIETRSVPGKEHDVRIVSTMISSTLMIQCGIVLEDESETIQVLRRTFITTMAAVFFFAAIVGWFMANRALSGVREITQTAWQISKGSLDKRVPSKNRGREIEELAQMFNHMLDQIQRVIREMREMTDNIAHDLKSPITRIRGTAEVTLTTGESNRSVKEYEQMAANTIEGCDHLLEMIDTTLDIAETEAGVGAIEFSKIDMTDLVHDVCDLFAPLAENEDKTMILEIANNVALYGDKKRLQRLMGNLLDNAVKYTPASGTITISLNKNSEGDVLLRINDTGFGIPSQDLPHIFERFYRGDSSRSETGSGLGLSLVKAIVKAHQAVIDVRSTPDKGSTFEIKFPCIVTEV